MPLPAPYQFDDAHRHQLNLSDNVIFIGFVNSPRIASDQALAQEPMLRARYMSAVLANCTLLGMPIPMGSRRRLLGAVSAYMSVRKSKTCATSA